MTKRSRSKKLNHLLDVRDSIQHLKELLAANQGLNLAIVRKNLHYAILKEEELWKAGYGVSTNSLKTLQPQEETV
jgi:hypothetical protein